MTLDDIPNDPLPLLASSLSASKSVKTAPAGLKTRLKSAIRLQSSPDIDRKASKTKLDKAKTVQFPLDPVQRGIDDENEGDVVRKGNKKPVDPEDVLSREGEDAAGTSAGAAEEALQDDEDEEVLLPGEVIMRGM